MFPDLNQILGNLRNNPFTKQTEAEKIELGKIEEATKKEIKELVRESKELLDDQRYHKLKSKFKQVYEQNMKLIVFFDSDDPYKYLMKMRTFQIQLRTLQDIVTTPEEFVKKDEIDNANKNSGISNKVD